jgi:hypothetical protein
MPCARAMPRASCGVQLWFDRDVGNLLPVDWSPDGRAVVTGDRRGRVAVWDIDPDRDRWTLSRGRRTARRWRRRPAARCSSKRWWTSRTAPIRRSGCGSGAEWSGHRPEPASPASRPRQQDPPARRAPLALVARVAAAAGLEELALAAIRARPDAHASTVRAGGAHQTARPAISMHLVLVLPARATAPPRLPSPRSGASPGHCTSLACRHRELLHGPFVSDSHILTQELRGD